MMGTQTLNMVHFLITLHFLEHIVISLGRLKTKLFKCVIYYCA